MTNTNFDSRKLRKKLLLKQKADAIDAAQRLLTQDGINPEVEAKKFEAYNAILKKLDKGPPLDKWIAVLVAFICIAILGFLYAMPRGKTKFLLNLKTETILTRLSNPLNFPKVKSIIPPLQVKGLDRLDSLIDQFALQSKHGDVWLDIVKGKITLPEFNLDKKGEIAIETLTDTIHFYMKGYISGSFQVSGNAKMRAGNQGSVVEIEINKHLIGPELLDFETKNKGAVPTEFKFNTIQPIVLINTEIDSLAFVRELSKNTSHSHSISTIVSGTISLPEINKIIELHPGDELVFRALSGRLTHLEIGKQINIQFAGSAESIRIGPKDLERTLEPNWLIYLYNQEKLVFIYSSFLFIWGILWSIRKTIFA